MKSDIANLKSSMESIDLTIAYDLSRGLKNTRSKIQALKSAVMANSANIKNTKLDGELNSLADRKLRAEVAHLSTELGHARNVTTSIMTEIHTLKTMRSAVGLLNITSDIADLKSSKTQDYMNVSIIDMLSRELKTNRRSFQELKSAVIANRESIRSTKLDEELNGLQQRKLLEEVAHLSTKVNNTRNVTNTMMTEIRTLSVNIENRNTNLQTPYDQFMIIKADLMMTKARLTIAEREIITLRNNNNPRTTAIELTVMKSDIADLKSSKTQQPINDAMSRDLRSNTRAIQALQFTVDANSDRIRSIKLDGEVNGRQQRNLQDEVASLRTIINNARNAPKSKIKRTEVVFSLDWLGSSASDDVAFQVTQHGDEDGWTTLRFSTVNLNQGGGYNSASGYFTAPVSGTYLFWCNILIYHSDGRIYIYKGSTSIAQGFTYTADNQVAMTVVTHMNKGEQVHFTAGSTDITVDGKESHYGGALLHAS